MDRRHFLAVMGSALGAATVSAGAPSQARAETGATAGRHVAEMPIGRVSYVDRGSGPAAILIHGWPLNVLEWRNVIPGLKDLRRCIAPDLLGFGDSLASSGTEITPWAQADAIIALMDKLKLSRADVIANDSGGLVAQILTAQHPDRVRTLLLTNCDAVGDNPPPAFVPLAKAAAAGKLAELFIRPQLADLALARSARGIGSAFADPLRLTQTLLQAYLAPLVSSPERERQFNVFTASLGHDDLTNLQGSLRAFSGPVRIVWGTQDKLFSPASPQILAAAFPSSRGIRMVADAKIYVPEDRPDVLIDEARTLWAT